MVRLNWELQPWFINFWQNLVDYLFRRNPPQALTSRPGRYWTDVFVDQSLGWKNLGRSCCYHFLTGGIVYVASLPFYLQQNAELVNPFQDTTISYYQPSEYIPPIEIQSSRARVARKGDLRQQIDTILSVSHRADNTEQTVIAPEPPTIAMNRPLPNLIAISRISQAPPVGTVAESKPKLVFPEVLPITPPPDVSQQRSQLTMPVLPENSAIPPTPEATARNLSELKISNLEATPINAEPKLPVAQLDTQHPLPGLPEPVAPAPEAATIGESKAAATLIALNLNPSPEAPPALETLQVNNRRGMFATARTGRPGGGGEPDLEAGGEGPGGDSFKPLPDQLGLKAVLNGATGTKVALAKPAPTIDAPARNLQQPVMAAVTPRREVLASIPRTPPAVSARDNDPLANQVFRGRKYYTMALNAPNLTSAGGSWIFRFAELVATTGPGEDLTAPVALEKVDPAYPADLMRERIEGVVVLRAVIRADGNVADVQVLEGFDDRLDENARRALAHWHFIPATRNGSPVDLEAVVRIPFKARSSF